MSERKPFIKGALAGVLGVVALELILAVTLNQDTPDQTPPEGEVPNISKITAEKQLTDDQLRDFMSLARRYANSHPDCVITNFEAQVEALSKGIDTSDPRPVDKSTSEYIKVMELRQGHQEALKEGVSLLDKEQSRLDKIRKLISYYNRSAKFASSMADNEPDLSTQERAELSRIASCDATAAYSLEKQILQNQIVKVD